MIFLHLAHSIYSGRLHASVPSSLALDVYLAYWEENQKPEFYIGANLIITRVSTSQTVRDSENNIIKKLE